MSVHWIGCFAIISFENSIIVISIHLTIVQMNAGTPFTLSLSLHLDNLSHICRREAI